MKSALWFSLLWRRVYRPVAQASILFSLLVLCAAGQQLPGNRQIVVRVRDARGAPVGPVPVNLRAQVGSFNFTAHTQSDGTLVFTRLTPGDYLLEVSTPGYRVALEEVALPLAYPNIVPQVYIYLQKDSEPDRSAAPSGLPLQDSRLIKEIRKAREKLEKNDLDDAEKHLQRALKAAPADAEVQYLFGMLEVRRNATPAAEAHLKKAIDLYPHHLPALRALGRVLFQKGDLAGAIQWLEVALTVNGRSADDHSLLAAALLQQNQLDKAEFHAQQALDLSPNAPAELRLLLCEIVLAKADYPRAEKLLDAYLRDFPSDAGAPTARSVLGEIRRRGPNAAISPEKALPVGISAPVSPVESPTPAEWAPPDVDTDQPAILHDVPCNLTEVLERTRLRVQDMAGSLGDLNADEVVSHTDISEHGEPKQTQTRRFDYTVSIDKSPSGALIFKEMRDGVFGMEALGGFSTNAIAVMAMVFHPYYADDFDVRCQGQAIWQGQPVWLLHFSQRADRPPRIHGFRSRAGSFQIPLKGRAWVAANSFEIVRLETAMLRPLPEALLEREQMVIEYRPVRFEQRHHTFWLPYSADIYMQYRGKRWHRRHLLQNYVHFAVDVRQKINAPEVPKDPPPL